MGPYLSDIGTNLVHLRKKLLNFVVKDKQKNVGKVTGSKEKETDRDCLKFKVDIDAENQE